MTTTVPGTLITLVAVTTLLGMTAFGAAIAARRRKETEDEIINELELSLELDDLLTKAEKQMNQAEEIRLKF